MSDLLVANLLMKVFSAATCVDERRVFSLFGSCSICWEVLTEQHCSLGRAGSSQSAADASQYPVVGIDSSGADPEHRARFYAGKASSGD